MRPRKALAQHFLVSTGVLQRILGAAELGQDDLVVEVGPGLGVLTDALAKRVRQVVALELDDGLAAALEARYASQPRVRILRGDARSIPLEHLVSPGQPYKVVANLPYYAATAIVRRFLEWSDPPLLLVVMLQREVAQRMVAQPGEMTLLSVGVQLYGRAKIVAAVPPHAFRPAPEVTSAIVRIDPLPRPLIPAEEAEEFFTVARAGFSAPRKQLQGALSHALGRPSQDVRALLGAAGIEPTRRAQTLSLEEWRTLYEVVRANQG